MKVLIADDSVSMRRILERALMKLGFHDFVSVSTGTEAVHAQDAADDGFDLIITDWLMPSMDGIELTERVRTGAWPQTPILMISTHHGEEQIVEALQAGVTNYLVKPFSFEALHTKVHQTMAAA